MMRLTPEGGVPDLRRFLEGCFRGWLACVGLYTVFGFFLVSRHAAEIAGTMHLFLCHGMTALIHPADPALTGLAHRWGSALLLGLPLGSLAALGAGLAFLTPWARGAVNRRTAAVGSLGLAAVLLALSFTPEMPLLSAVCSLLAPVFFLCTWAFAARRTFPGNRRLRRSVGWFFVSRFRHRYRQRTAQGCPAHWRGRTLLDILLSDTDREAVEEAIDELEMARGVEISPLFYAREEWDRPLLPATQQTGIPRIPDQ